MPSKSVVSASIAGCRWIDVEDPDERTLAKLQRTYGFSNLNRDDILSPTQRPKLDVQEDYAFFVFRFPVKSKGRRARATELDVLLTQDTIITFHSKDLHNLRSLISDTKLFKRRRSTIMGQGPSHVLFEVLHVLFEQVYSVADELLKQTDQLESTVFAQRKDQGETITNIADLRRRVLDYSKVAKPQAIFLQACLSSAGQFISPSVQSKWNTLIETAEAQWELFETTINVIKGISESNDSLTSHRFNQTLRLLTIISVLFLPATFVLSIVSTDTPGAPIQQFKGAFWLVLGILLTVQVIFVWFLRRRRVL